MRHQATKISISLTRWFVLGGLCFIAVGVLSYFQLERHRFESTSDFEFLFLERTFMLELVV